MHFHQQAVGTGGNLLDWVSQLTNPVGLIKKFQNFGNTVKSETDSMLEHAVLLVGIMAVVQLLTMIFMQPKIHMS